jgi:hypothetical protein
MTTRQYLQRLALTLSLVISCSASSAEKLPYIQLTAIGGDSMAIYRVDVQSGSVRVVQETSDKKQIDLSLARVHRELSAYDSQASLDAVELGQRLRVNANRAILSPDKKSVIAYFKDDSSSTSRAAWLIDTSSWRVVAEVPIDNSILYVKWTPDSGRAVIIERKFLRNSLSPWNLLSSLLGHGVGIYRYSMLVVDKGGATSTDRTEVVTGTYHSMGFAWTSRESASSIRGVQTSSCPSTMSDPTVRMFDPIPLTHANPPNTTALASNSID